MSLVHISPVLLELWQRHTWEKEQGIMFWRAISLEAHKKKLMQIMNGDVRGFTAMSERLGAEKVVETMNQIFQ